jgi:hypothetical protein
MCKNQEFYDRLEHAPDPEVIEERVVANDDNGDDDDTSLPTPPTPRPLPRAARKVDPALVTDDSPMPEGYSRYIPPRKLYKIVQDPLEPLSMVAEPDIETMKAHMTTPRTRAPVKDKIVIYCHWSIITGIITRVRALAQC